MIRIKNEGDRARPRGITPEIVLAMTIAGSLYGKMFHGEDMVITSMAEVLPFRKKGSKHLSGNAFDIRTRNMTSDLIRPFADQLGEALGTDYDVVVESNHIHVEFDPSA